MAAVRPILLSCILFPVLASMAFSAEDATVSPAKADGSGALVHTVNSPYQAKETKIVVVPPSKIEAGRRCPVLYVLPVEGLDGKHYGDSLAEVKKYDLANKYGVICVLPTFAALPWYCDHPTDPKLRQETYFLKVLLPFVERTYPARAGREGRLLVGYSKSGYGAFALLLRHPELFEKAAAWDAPLMMKKPEYGMAPIVGTMENFRQNYWLSKLFKEKAGEFGGPVRLFHLGYDNFRDQHEAAEKLLTELKIAHQYRDGPKRKHSWNSGWLPDAVEMLVGKDKAK
jgi:S-formylglutathione hydrolase FrmB